MATTTGDVRRVAFAAVLLVCAGGLGFLLGRKETPAPRADVAQLELANTATVLTAVRGLARLETVAYHMERVVDLKERQPRLFGLVHADDAILLVAAGDVIAGVDLGKLSDGDVTLVAEPRTRLVRLRLPPPELLSVRLDNARTYVHTRRTDLLAQRGEQLETRARQLAETSIRDAALEAGILERARQSAERTLSTLTRSLGYDRTELVWRPESQPR
jgi:hypothetical protein